MSESPPAGPRSRGQGIKLHDMIGLVVGYGLAALLLRTIPQNSSSPDLLAVVVFCLSYAWLGLAMSGPMILLADRRARPVRHERRKPKRIHETPAAESDSVEIADPPRFSNSEVAWILIGAYWIALTLVVVPLKTTETPWPLISFIQIIATALIRFARPSGTATPVAQTWKRTAARSLLYSWPVVWCLLIVLATTL